KRRGAACRRRAGDAVGAEVVGGGVVGGGVVGDGVVRRGGGGCRRDNRRGRGARDAEQVANGSDDGGHGAASDGVHRAGRGRRRRSDDGREGEGNEDRDSHGAALLLLAGLKSRAEAATARV